MQQLIVYKCQIHVVVIFIFLISSNISKDLLSIPSNIMEKDTINSFPAEVLLEIFTFLDTATIQKAVLVNKR